VYEANFQRSQRLCTESLKQLEAKLPEGQAPPLAALTSAVSFVLDAAREIVGIAIMGNLAAGKSREAEESDIVVFTDELKAGFFDVLHGMVLHAMGIGGGGGSSSSSSGGSIASAIGAELEEDMTPLSMDLLKAQYRQHYLEVGEKYPEESQVGRWLDSTVGADTLKMYRFRAKGIG
jgi:hypothetical protein